MKIIINKIQCRHCGDVIESKTVHDFKTCTCGSVSVDGGKQYLKRSFKKPDDYIDLSMSQRDIEDLDKDLLVEKDTQIG